MLYWVYYYCGSGLGHPTTGVFYDSSVRILGSFLMADVGDGWGSFAIGAWNLELGSWLVAVILYLLFNTKLAAGSIRSNNRTSGIEWYVHNL